MAKRRTLKRGTKKVPTFIQEYDYYCGPATAKMVLRWLKVTRSQDSLWDLIGAATNALGLSRKEPCLGDFTLWSTRPEPLAKVIKDLSGADIKLVSETTAAATDHAVVWSILQDIPAVALVYGANHWIVVHGYHVSREPTSINDTNYQLHGFDVIDSNRPQKARDYIPASAWRSNYMTGVVCGKFDGKFVAICDPEPMSSKGGPTVSPTVSRTRQNREPSGGLLRAERLSRMAFEGVRLAGLLEDETWKRAMNGVSTGAYCLVHRLDRPSSFYAIVPFEKGGRVQAQAMLDPYTGELLGAGASEDLGKSLSMPTSTDDAINRVADKYFDLPGEHPHMRLRREGLSASPTLVWQPCQESLTPYLPFTQVTYGKHTLYVRTDGKVFTSLTSPRRGS